MAIGVLAAAGSRQARRLQRCLEAAVPGSVVRLDRALEPEDRASLDQAEPSWNGVRLDRLEALYVHGFAYQDPVVPPADPVCDWSLWQCGAVIAQQKYSFLHSLLARLEALRVPLFNPVSAHLAAFDRFGLLMRLGRGGLAIPELLATNDPAAAAAFQQAHQTVVWRPATGAAAWQLFKDRQRDHLVGIDRPPVLLAQTVTGPFLRGYVMKGRLVAILGCHPPNRDGLERLETLVPIAPAEIAGADRIGPAVAALGFGLAVVSFVAGADGPCCYDLDPDPVLTDLPEPFQTDLIGSLAATLQGRPLPPLLAREPAQRPSLLLRRMLTIQFEMEATKYAL